jgi:hypothetical protein
LPRPNWSRPLPRVLTGDEEPGDVAAGVVLSYTVHPFIDRIKLSPVPRRGGVMAEIVIRCPVFGVIVPTGITTEIIILDLPRSVRLVGKPTHGHEKTHGWITLTSRGLYRSRFA